MIRLLPNLVRRLLKLLGNEWRKIWNDQINFAAMYNLHAHLTGLHVEMKSWKESWFLIFIHDLIAVFVGNISKVEAVVQTKSVVNFVLVFVYLWVCVLVSVLFVVLTLWLVWQVSRCEVAWCRPNQTFVQCWWAAASSAATRGSVGSLCQLLQGQGWTKGRGRCWGEGSGGLADDIKVRKVVGGLACSHEYSCLFVMRLLQLLSVWSNSCHCYGCHLHFSFLAVAYLFFSPTSYFCVDDNGARAQAILLWVA